MKKMEKIIIMIFAGIGLLGVAAAWIYGVGVFLVALNELTSR